MGFRHNNVLHRNHFRKDWQRRVKTWYDQPGKKVTRRIAREKKATALGGRPTQLLRPAVRCPTIRYNRRLRAGRGFTLEELKAAGIRRKEALSIGIPVDHRRRNRSEDSLELNTQRLKTYKEKLVLLPKKSKKKGEKKDAMDVSPDNTTRDLATILPIPTGYTPEQPRAITAEEKEFNAFATLRKARSDARLVGVRKIRAAKKEEEAAAQKK
ncbi:ribosomal protein L13e [Atractiella rhizophila]|nr:ribosomal protein L13e [Atractiella rhizophila]KAH8925072.1 ribosomal protein L13e [Atractiella rhizophila]